jgi:hypothetical protein
LPALKLEEIVGQLRSRRPDVLHLAAHGTSRAFFLSSDRGKTVALGATKLLTFLPLDNPPRIVYLNSCDSHEMAQALVESGRVKTAIGSTAPIANDTARNGAVTFYTLSQSMDCT